MQIVGVTSGVRVQRDESTGVRVQGEDQEFIVDSKGGTPSGQLVSIKVEDPAKDIQANHVLLT